MSNRNYPPYNKIRSSGEMKEWYEKARKEIADYKNTAKLANASARDSARDARKYKTEAKVANRNVLTLTKRQKASEEANKSTMWSGAAAISVTILYETWKIVGFPGGKEWIEWWNHEAVYGVMMWFGTVIFAQMYKASKGQ